MGALNAGGVYKFSEYIFCDFLSNRLHSGCKQGCYKWFLPERNYVKFMLAVAAATTCVLHVSCSWKTPPDAWIC